MTPSGTPAETKPMNSGTAEHEQNGVRTPRPAAMTLPAPSRRPESRARVFSGREEAAHDAHGEDNERRAASAPSARRRRRRPAPRRRDCGGRPAARPSAIRRTGTGYGRRPTRGRPPDQRRHPRARRPAGCGAVRCRRRRHAACRSADATALSAASTTAAMLGARSGLRR